MQGGKTGRLRYHGVSRQKGRKNGIEVAKMNHQGKIALQAGMAMWLVSLLFGLASGLSRPVPVHGSDVAEVVLQGTWGSAPEQLGLRPPSPGVMPDAPFQGPGGFRVDAAGAVWITDSVNRAVKVFREGRVDLFPVAAGGLGDLDLTGDLVAVVTRDPEGLVMLRQQDGAELRRIPLPCRSPGRLQAVDEQRFLLHDLGGGLWWVRGEMVATHPVAAMEPVGTAERLYGIVYDFDQSSRKIIWTGWKDEETDSELFALLRVPEQRIVFTRLLGLQDQTPWALVVTADTPGVYRAFHFGPDGKIAREARLPVLTGTWLPAWWVAGPLPVVYGFRSDAQGFTIIRQKLE
ncbi:MAG: hypothetical protein OZSIB_1281 [Candidatus Ozemobacter sibiricus]|uniref:NHL repeat domain protein n=1 Tax=Candidatus Ozemobacter sibiricus TaxID=2268124 RepID=A0A367ZLB5_9BACT|nr:MAG: hypothetical protein OZSIB_1281 [Candidatus Ozemobacter sibiricus]